MNTLTKLCSCGAGMSYASYYVPERRMRITGWHCSPCGTVTERTANLDVTLVG